MSEATANRRLVQDVGRIQERSEQSAVFSTAKDLALVQQTARHLASAHE